MAKKTVVETIKEAFTEKPKVKVKSVCENCNDSGRYCSQCSDPKVVDNIK